jgi:hypothetical protein
LSSSPRFRLSVCLCVSVGAGREKRCVVCPNGDTRPVF